MTTMFLTKAQRDSLNLRGAKCGASVDQTIDLKCQRLKGHRGLHIALLLKDGGRVAAKWPRKTK